ncbi:glycosyltransferase [Desulfovibrio desulfuricans]|uniref:glycosyltransferase n=1 Tax=Desulfovibrio desulfuricans TaxID=876 RepID=UPI0039843930
MLPLLTIAVANYNHAHLLPTLFESILQLRLPSLEVVLVDDASDEPCDALVDQWRKKGLDIQLVRHTERKYTKGARISGILAARGEYIAFADADDTFLNNGVLEKNLQIAHELQVDIVHMSLSTRFQPNETGMLWEWSRPFAAKLENRDIFTAYLDKNLRAHCMYGKLFRRAQWLNIIETAKASSIRHWREDLFLVSLFLFHAQSYIGSTDMAYAVTRFDLPTDARSPLIHKKGEPAETAEAAYILLQEMVPHLKQQGCPDKLIRIFSTFLLTYLYKAMRELTERATATADDQTFENIIAQATRNISLEMLTKTLLLGYNEALYIYDRKSRILLEDRQKIANLQSELAAWKTQFPTIMVETKKQPHTIHYIRNHWPEGATDTASLKDAYKGRRCFIIGNGPSLNKIDFSLLRDEVTIGCNGIFYKTRETGFIPTLYTVEDNEFIAANAKEISDYTQPLRIIPICYWQFFENRENTQWFEIDSDFYSADTIYYQRPRFSRNFADCSFAGHTISYTNMQLAYWLGCTEVYLIGMDHQYVIPKDAVISGNCIVSQEDDANHFHAEYFKGKVWHDPRLDMVELNFKLARRYFEADDRHIYNATIGGKLEIFDRVPFASLF